MSTNSADPKARPELQRFHMVQKTQLMARGRSQRDPTGIKVSPNGIATVNVAGTELFDSIARAQGLDEKTYCVVFGADVNAVQVAAVPVDAETAGATPVRRDPKKKTMTIYLADLFAEAHELRVSSTRWCQIEQKPDGGGGSFVLIHLGQGLERRRTRRSHTKAMAPALA